MTMLDATAAPLGADARAFVLLKSRRRLDLLNPDPQAWTDGDLAAGLSRTMRWAGASQWAHPLSVAQHSLTVLAIREAEGPLTAREGLRELLHDAKFMLGWDCVAPLKAQLGQPFRELEARLQAAVDARYQLPSWTAEDYAKHKRADRLAAASEAFHVVGWSRTDMVKALGIEIHPLLDDPLPPTRAAQHLFMERFRELAHASRCSMSKRPASDARQAILRRQSDSRDGHHGGDRRHPQVQRSGEQTLFDAQRPASHQRPSRQRSRPSVPTGGAPAPSADRRPPSASASAFATTDPAAGSVQSTATSLKPRKDHARET